MKALSLWQPWASLVAYGIKTIETRHWSTRYRGPLAIHAAKRTPINGECPGEIGYDGLGNLIYWLPEPWTEEQQVARGYPPDGDLIAFPLPLGTVVATCQLVDVVPMTLAGDYGPDDGTRYFEPHLLLNGLDDKLWWWTGDTAVDVEDQRPYGNFASERFAWILADHQWIEPVPATGRQGLWNWEVVKP